MIGNSPYSHKHLNRTISRCLLLLSVSSVLSSNIYAAAFALVEQNASGLGNAYAGKSAIAEDASTSFYNPAGLVLMRNHQVVGAGVNVFINSQAKMIAARHALNSQGANPISGKAKDTSNIYALIPAFHIAGPLTDKWFYGLSVTSPYGLKTKYSKNSQFRYFADLTEVQVIDVNPNLAYKLDNAWSFGAGLSAQYVKAKLNKQIDNIGLAPPPGGAGTDGSAKNTADDISLGYNLGALFQPTKFTRIGAAFRSKVKHTATGDLKVANISPSLVTAAGLVDQHVKATVTLPETLSISAFQTLSADWDIMGDITYTNWKRFKKLVLQYSGNLADAVVEEKFKNSFRVSAGFNYNYKPNLTLKFGGAFDQTPVENKHRNLRIPDNNRIWAALGVKYKFNKNSAVDVGYSHLFVKSSSIREIPISTAAPFSNAIAVAKVDGSTNLLGVQFTYDFV